MATPLDTGMISFLMPAIVFMFILVVVYAMLTKIKLFGENAAFNAIISFCVALMFIVVPQASTVLLDFTPWMLLLIGLVVFIFLFFMALGVKGDDLIKNVAKDSSFITFAIIAVIILFLIALTNSFGPIFLTNQDPGFWNSVKRTLFHPRMLGVLFLLAVGSYAIRFISGNE